MPGVARRAKPGCLTIELVINVGRCRRSRSGEQHPPTRHELLAAVFRPIALARSYLLSQPQHFPAQLQIVAQVG